MRKTSCVLANSPLAENSLDEFFMGCGHDILCSNMLDHLVSLEEIIDGEWHTAWLKDLSSLEDFRGNKKMRDTNGFREQMQSGRGVSHGVAIVTA